MPGFVHLHLHSEYSLLDGACRIADIPGIVAENGHDSVAITDHGVMYGAVAFWRTCRDKGINPIIGCEVYVAPGSRFEKIAGPEGGSHHLVLLCTNNTGYQNLIYMVSKAYTEGFYSRPRVDFELLETHHEGLIALSACLAGEIPRALSRGDRERAKSVALRLSHIFGKDNFYIELQNHGIAEQRQILPDLYSLAQECGLGVVATNDVHYLRKSDARAQSVLMCIQTNTTIADGRPMGFETDEFYYKSTDEMTRLFGGFTGAIENTQIIADRCHVAFDFDRTLLPAYPLPDGINAADELRHLCESGIAKLIGNGRLPANGHTLDEYRDRADFELSVIHGMGYDDYFLIVADYVGYAKSAGIPVGPGRGSGCGSLVAFATGITDIDPLRFDLLFERFLNPERVSMPDIDIDFCYNRRDEVLEYVRTRYGEERVSQIVTFGTLAARAAIRDCGRALGMAYADVDIIAKLIPREPDITIKQALEVNALKEKYDQSEAVRTLIDTATALEGMPRNVSIHAAGVVITGEPVTDYVPISLSNGTVITQYDMDTIASLGLLKFDFLALRYLTIINDAVAQICETVPGFDIEKIDLTDRDTYTLISSGQTAGVFQLESSGMKAMLSNLKPESIDDVLAAIALYRPGPMDSIPKYIEGKNNPESISYPHPSLIPILKPTYGCIVYQEQVMSVFRVIAGYSLGHADLVRRAMSKKKASALEAERTTFIDGAISNGMTQEAAARLFDDMSSFASYAFNKSHAAAYAVIAFRTAYLKAHYPREYYAALLTSVLGSPDKISEYISEASKSGIRVLPPDINRSMLDFHVSGDDITFGLLALKNLGRQFVSALIKERGNVPFTSFSDFLDRTTGCDVNRRMIETLIKSGAFDSLGVYRSRLMATLDASMLSIADKGRHNLDGQLDMFTSPSPASGADDGETAQAPMSVYPDIPEFSRRELLALEKEASGMYFTGHVLDGYALHVERLKPIPIASVVAKGDDDDSDAGGVDGESSTTTAYGDLSDGNTVACCGVITGITLKTTKNNGRMAFFKLEDQTASVETVVFPKKLDQYRSFVKAEEAVTVSGNLSVKEGEKPKILLNSMSFLLTDDEFRARAERRQTGIRNAAIDKKALPERKEENSSPDNATKPVKHVQIPEKPSTVYIKVPSCDSVVYKRCANLVDIFDGETKVSFYFGDVKEYTVYCHGITVSRRVIDELIAIAGDGAVVVR